MEVGNWRGKAAKFDPWVYEKVGVDDSVLANYRDSGGHSVQLYIGYYKSQREGDLAHSPKNCMVGGGWNISDINVINLTVPSYDEPMQAICLTMTKGTAKEVVLYWYYERGRVITSEYYQKFYLIVDAITRKRTDGSLIRLISTVGDSEDATREKLKDFAIEIFPIVKAHIPA
jgi:EpsI family protein